MEFGPIVRATLRNKTGAILIALQIAFTMTVVVNSWFMVSRQLARMDRPSGLAEAELFHIASTGFADDFNVRVSVDEDLLLLRQTPGVVDAVQMNAIPLSGGGWSMGLQTQPGENVQGQGVAVYMVDDHALATFDVELIAGANFTPGDIDWRTPAQVAWPAKTIVSAATARALFPDEEPAAAVGKTVYIANTQPTMIIGVMDLLHAPWSGSSLLERTILVPQKMEFVSTRYMIRTEPGRLDDMMPRVEELLAASNPGRIVRDMQSMPETRERSYRTDSGLATVLIVIMVVLVAITAVGVLGLASFSVKRRIKQIGTRRALGATRTDILRYFLVENLFITTAGVALGGVMTVAFNMWLVDMMNFPKVDWLAIPLGMLALVVVGQLAVLGPARRACEVSPAVATRTV